MRLKFPLHKVAYDAIASSLHRYSVGLMLHDPDDIGLASGTLSCSDSHHFVLTAAHAVRDRRPEQIRFVHTALPATTDIRLAQVRRHPDAQQDDILDLAVLELDAEAVERLKVSKEFLPITRIGSALPASTVAPLVVVGHPASYVDHSQAVNKQLSFQPLAYVTFAASGKGLLHNYDPAYHVLLEYPEEGSGDETGHRMVLPDPNGMSGGGVFSFNLTREGLWAPECVSLVAVEHAWFRGERLLKCSHGSAILRFLAEIYPE